ncbi:MAG: metal-sensing transcriptional repressor [Acholeplasmatales bacterium]|nr:metal-sensing transcriptional repressor [Acholeplasmatales bacterium]
MDKNEVKKTFRNEELKDSLNKRLNRIIGQMNGVKKMIDEDKYCGDVLIQLSAIEKGIASVADIILDNHMHHCVADAIKEGDNSKIDEVMELIRRFK